MRGEVRAEREQEEIMAKIIRLDKPVSHFGACPECGKHDGYVNIGKSYFFV